MTTEGPERNFSHERNIYKILDYGSGYMTFVKTHGMFLQKKVNFTLGKSYLMKQRDRQQHIIMLFSHSKYYIEFSLNLIIEGKSREDKSEAETLLCYSM